MSFRTSLLAGACLLLALPSTADSPWTIDKGAAAATTDAFNGVHIWQDNAQDIAAYGYASLPIKLKNALDWQVSFDVKFGKLGTAGTSVRVMDGDTTIAWVGADADYGNMSSFVGDKAMVSTQRADEAWHTVDVSKMNGFVSIDEDGKRVGAAPAIGTPTSLFVGSRPGGRGHETEIFVRNVITGSIDPRSSTAPWQQSDIHGSAFGHLLPDSTNTPAKPLLHNNADAVREGAIEIKSDITESSPLTIVNLSVTNNSDKPISFWTNSYIVFIDGTVGELRLGAVSDRPFRDLGQQTEEAIASVMASGGSGSAMLDPSTSPNTQIINKESDTVILPHETRYFRGGTGEGNANSTPIVFRFQGNGWTGFESIIHSAIGPDYP